MIGSCLIYVSASWRAAPRMPSASTWASLMEQRGQVQGNGQGSWLVLGPHLLLLENSRARYSGKEKGIFLMDFFKKVNQGSGMVCSRRAPGSQITVDIQWHHKAGVSLLPHTGYQTKGLPKCCIVHWLSLPSLYASHRHQASASSAFDRLLIPLQKWRRSTTIFHRAPLGNRRGKKGAEDIHQHFLISYSDKVGPRQVDPVSCLGALSCLPARACSLTHQVQQGEGLNSKGASTPVGRLPGWRGGLDWRNRRSCTGFWAEQQDCSTRTAQGHSSWHIV